MNAGGTALEWKDDTDSQYGFTTPLVNTDGNVALTIVPIILGGTNISTYTVGDILYCNSTNTLIKLAIGAEDQILTVNSSGVPNWETGIANPLWSVNPTNNLHPTNLDSRLCINSNSGLTNQHFLNVYGDIYFQPSQSVDIEAKTSTMDNPIYLTCGQDYQNKIVFGSANSENQSSNYGSSIANINTGNDINSFTIKTIKPTGTQPRLSINTNAGLTNIICESAGGDCNVLIGEVSNSYKFEAVQNGTTFKLKNYDDTAIFGYTRSTNAIDFGNTTANMNIDNITGINNTANTIVSTTTYGWFVSGLQGRQIGITGAITNFPFLGSNSTTNFLISINNITDVYEITATNTTDIKHYFRGDIEGTQNLKLNTSTSAVIGTITNLSNTDYPAIPFGSFNTLYAVNQMGTKNLLVHNRDALGNYREVKLTCNSAYDTLEINKNTDITGGLTATVSITSNKFQALNTTNNYMESSSSHGFGFYGTAGRQLSLRGISNFPFLGSTSTQNFVIHINNVGDTYYQSGTSQANTIHTFKGNISCDHNLTVQNGNIVVFGNITGTNCDITIDGDITTNGDITGTNTDINIDGSITVGEDIFMSRNQRIQYNSDTYFYEYLNDIVLKMGTSTQGGDYKIFRNNTPTSTAGNWEADLFISNGASSIFEIYGGYGRSGYQGEFVKIGNDIICLSTTPTICSDDRLKTEEVLITNATDTIMKLKPQTYMKSQWLGTEDPMELPAGFDIEKNNSKKFEAGLIAQEIYYICPELRHIVKRIGDNVKELPENMDIDDLQNDPDWNALGWNAKEASVVAYTELIPYLITSNQEQQVEIDTLKTELNDIKELLARNNIV
tara:strand:+ start:119 stop:2641 length:2523 start_codon:yes stop_codon:yes gene_type:complete